MMELCSENHGEVCYNNMSGDCPACFAIEEAKEQLYDEIGKLTEKVDKLQKEVDELEAADYARR